MHDVPARYVWQSVEVESTRSAFHVKKKVVRVVCIRDPGRPLTGATHGTDSLEAVAPQVFR